MTGSLHLRRLETTACARVPVAHGRTVSNAEPSRVDQDWDGGGGRDRDRGESEGAGEQYPNRPPSAGSNPSRDSRPERSTQSR
ncbi:hypothetical protein OB955_03920 [Halobacteria archaeon AArc-m2/3/4]|uniref:Uncharacterized protein n=1 Tax=Natronoglomus mannanivorans TaxID=2979990 RepID=A0AAP3E2H5_9EURY|nr:hypothetical protein [Halobacteria archaeon AArc-xg1-1]MCU4971885.1 hypothetical protein [Halobacteria archaeon AArc-m2/3/4]